jgi:multidrug efflux pump subunit AcrB
MNLIQIALRRPLTVVVLVIAVVLGAWLALKKMSRDIFPPLGIPTIYVAQPYGGMDPAQMEGYLTYYYEYHFLYITGIEHVESKSIQGASLMKLQFHPGTDMSQALSEVIGYVNRARAFMPPGTVPPFVTRFDAGSVPVGYLVFSTTNENRTVGQMQDAALNLVRPLFATLPGVSAPPPFGGSARTIVVNVKPDRLRAYNFSPDEIVQALSQANTISPSGNMNLGDKYPIVLKPCRCASAPVARCFCGTSPPSRMPPTSSPAMRSSMAAARSISPSPSAPMLQRSASSSWSSKAFRSSKTWFRTTSKSPTNSINPPSCAVPSVIS